MNCRALYACVMTRDPVRVEQPANRLAFPLNVRALVAGWKLLFLDRVTAIPLRISALRALGSYLRSGSRPQQRAREGVHALFHRTGVNRSTRHQPARHAFSRQLTPERVRAAIGL